VGATAKENAHNMCRRAQKRGGEVKKKGSVREKKEDWNSTRIRNLRKKITKGLFLRGGREKPKRKGTEKYRGRGGIHALRKENV